MMMPRLAVFLWLAAAVHGFITTTTRPPRSFVLRMNADDTPPKAATTTKIVLVAGFESFNRDLYNRAAQDLMTMENTAIQLTVFSNADIRLPVAKSTNNNTNDNNEILQNVNPAFRQAMQEADAFLGSLLFDYDDVQVVRELVRTIDGPRLVFESATELMEFNRVGQFNMTTTNNGSTATAGPPPAVRAILSKFGASTREEDKLSGYLKLLKVGPDLLRYVPGDKAADLRAWLEAYRYWNQGGRANVAAMLQIVAEQVDRTKKKHTGGDRQDAATRPPLSVTPDIGLLHPLMMYSHHPTEQNNNHQKKQKFYFDHPRQYMEWRLSNTPEQLAQQQQQDGHSFTLAPKTAPRVAILLYRKHVITEQPYIWELITQMEADGLIPVPIFINGVEAHTIVRDLLTSRHKYPFRSRNRNLDTFQPDRAATVDAIVNTVGFPLVGGPAGSMQAGRNVAVAEELLTDMNVPYTVAAPLLLQTLEQWQQNGVLGLQSVVLYSLPELDGAIDTVVLGGLVGDDIRLVPERVTKLHRRVSGWVQLRRTPRRDRHVAVCVYGFPPQVGAVGTAALLNVPQSLQALLRRLHQEGYDVGGPETVRMLYETTDHSDAPNHNNPNENDNEQQQFSFGESLVAALAVLCDNPVVSAGAAGMEAALEAQMARARAGDAGVAAALARGLGNARVWARDVTADQLDDWLGPHMAGKVHRAWNNDKSPNAPGVSRQGHSVVAGLQIGNVFLFVQPLLGLEGDPMRLLFERDLTPHPQFAATYKALEQPREEGGIGANAVIHLGMHGTVEWLPGQPLGNDRDSWSDELLGSLPNLYVYAANNPSESILAKRRGYGTLVSYNVPPYGRAGLYLELANLKELVDEYRSTVPSGSVDEDLLSTIYGLAQRSGMLNDVPFPSLVDDENDVLAGLTNKDAEEWVLNLYEYLNVLQERLFSSGLHTLGAAPTDEALDAYLEAYYGDSLTTEQRHSAIQSFRAEEAEKHDGKGSLLKGFASFMSNILDPVTSNNHRNSKIDQTLSEATKIASLLAQSTDELDSIVQGLDGGYIPPAPGGDLLRDGTSVLPTGRNIHALDPYRMPSPSAWVRGQRAAAEIIRQHQVGNDGKYPETVAVTLWGLDSIKTRGESVAIVLALVGAEPVKEGTGRIVRYDLVPLEKLNRPRVDVLASLSGIFRDSFANIVDLLDDMFERAAQADEPPEMNFIKKHVLELEGSGVTERAAARLFSNPPGDYGSMVNEVVGTGDWEDSESLGETWQGRNVFAYGRNEGTFEKAGTARPEVLDKLLTTTERVVQEIDSVEYGLSDIQEYYANTGALKKAAENRKSVDPTTGEKKKVALSIIEAFGGPSEGEAVPVKDVEEVLRLEYRSKLLNPKWRDAMLDQGSGGAYEISQRMTAMIGWSATAQVDNFVFDQAAERYALDDEVANKLQNANPEAFKNVVRRLLEAAGRGMWETDEKTLDRLRDMYGDVDDLVEQGSSQNIATMTV